jgi:hypothetical protein
MGEIFIMMGHPTAKSRQKSANPPDFFNKYYLGHNYCLPLLSGVLSFGFCYAFLDAYIKRS